MVPEPQRVCFACVYLCIHVLQLIAKLMLLRNRVVVLLGVVLLVEINYHIRQSRSDNSINVLTELDGRDG